eukprot:TRINITY_DN32313_c0_g1_i2.p1 TRINITY_DN32313_c0_g1~~TRINITY_DN32313_c0_g1_i2.p1  ORF type:complete len:241 (+),score=60.04 TRINITY_DN32313_c0_g1_i2:84-806(+)
MSTVGPHELQDEEVQGALFDVDGTLVDSMPRWFHGWGDVCPQFGLHMSEERYWGFAGQPVPEILRQLYREQKGGEEATQDFVERFIAAMGVANKERESTAGSPPRIDVVANIAREYVNAGIPVMAASSGLRHCVEAHIAAAGLSDVFPLEHIIVAGDLPPGRGKPQPDLFLKAAEILGVDPKRCRVYEDAEAGFEAGFRAGCHVVDVRAIPGYPMSPALKAAMAGKQEERQWLSSAALGA